MKILIIRRDNIGDLICTTPLFAALRRQYPQAYIAALVNSYNEPAIHGNPHLDAIFAYTKGKHAAGESVWRAYWRRAKLLWQLRRMRFDYVILATSGFAARSLKLAKMLAPAHIVGFITEQATSPKIDQAILHGDGGKLHETEDMYSEAWFEVGFANENLNNLNAAEKAYRQSTKLDNQNTDALFRLGFIAKGKEDKIEIKNIREQIAKVNPELLEDYNKLVGCSKTCD